MRWFCHLSLAMGCAASRPSDDDVATAPETTTEPSSPPAKPSLVGVGSSDQAFDELDILSTPSARTTGSSSIEDGTRHAKQDAAGAAVSALPPKSGLYWHFLPPSQQQAALCEVASKTTVETDTLPRWGESITSSLLDLGSISAVGGTDALATTTPYPGENARSVAHGVALCIVSHGAHILNMNTWPNSLSSQPTSRSTFGWHCGRVT